jgi:hypothetical protein
MQTEDFFCPKEMFEYICYKGIYLLQQPSRNEKHPENLAAYPYRMKKERNNRPKEWSETEGLDGVILRPDDGKIVTVGVANNQIELTISRYLAR